LSKASLYTFHRWISILALAPLAFWSISGLSHPMMAHFFKYRAPSYELNSSIKIDTTSYSIHDVCLSNRIDSIQDFRIVDMNEDTYYQVLVNESWRYFDATSTIELIGGDTIYAKYLTQCLMQNDDLDILKVKPITEFNYEYQEINRYLPVSKVSIRGLDKKLDVFVHTPTSQLVNINTTGKKVCLWIFSHLHKWQIFSFSKPFQKSIIILFLILIFLSSVVGVIIYTLNSSRFSKRKRSAKNKQRKTHWRLGLFLSLFIFSFSSSGLYHLMNEKAPPASPNQKEYFYLDDIYCAPTELLNSLNDVAFKQLSILKINEKIHYRLESNNTRIPIYLNSETLNVLQEGEQLYALETCRKTFDIGDHFEFDFIQNYSSEYGFINKRLPVSKIEYNNHTFYVDSDCGLLSKISNDNSKIQSFIFLNFHKFHFLNFLGKGLRDILLSLICLSIFFLSLSGLRLYFSK
jgi:hypothetical protein